MHSTYTAQVNPFFGPSLEGFLRDVRAQYGEKVAFYYAFNLLLAAYHSPLTTHYSLLGRLLLPRLQLTTYHSHSLLTAHYSLLTTH